MEKNLEHIKQILETLEAQSLDDSLIKDNKIYFIFKDNSYMVRMPSQKELSEAHRAKDKCQMDLITTEKVYTKSQIKKILKDTQNVDIDALELKRLHLQNDLKDVYLDYALVHPDDTAKKIEYTAKIKEIETEHLKLFIEITERLSPAIENQIEKAYVEYLASKCSFKIQDDNTEIRVWNKQEEFDNDNSGLVSEVVKFMSYLLIKTNR